MAVDAGAEDANAAIGFLEGRWGHGRDECPVE
jgi:hypothetical protein